MNVRNMMVSLVILFVMATPGQAATYSIDNKGAHAFIQFKIQHLGYSWLLGRFNTFDGSFVYDEKHPNAAKINIQIETKSVDSNHALRDKHLRSKDFLDVKRFPKATFVSTSITEDGNALLVKGKFTLHGVSRNIVIKGKHVGSGNDPWGNYRRGFEGETTIMLKDYDVLMDLGPASQQVQLYFSFEGIRQ